MSARAARRVQVRGAVQGVGFRPFVYRTARDLGLDGWVRNGGEGVEVHLEGEPAAIEAFLEALSTPPPAAVVARVEHEAVEPLGLGCFEIETSSEGEHPTVRISSDLPVCNSCLEELFDPEDRRAGYPYLNCTDCGPRYSIVLGLPYDRALTTMRDWPLCDRCAAEYEDPLHRRFHAQPTACPACGPTYALIESGGEKVRGKAAIEAAVARLRAGHILAIKGIGGYHLACDAGDERAVGELRTRKFRREKPFALMVPDLDAARRMVRLDAESERLLLSSARPVVVAEAIAEAVAGIAPENRDLGVMLPYAPLHHLLFDRGAPEVLVLTSANRSSEPIAYLDADAFERLAGVADAFLLGERPIARRVDDSVATVGALGPMILRRSRGLSPGVVARLPGGEPVLAVGADLKSSITLVVGGDAFVSQHIGDLEQHAAELAHRQTVRDLLDMYRIDRELLLVVHDLHPEYRSTRIAEELGGARRVAVQHHRAHVASVLAERGCFEERVLGVAFDGAGFGDDGSIWGGEIFAGSLTEGFDRVGCLLPAVLPGGDAGARFPVMAAAGFLAGIEDLPDLRAVPFVLPDRYFDARRLVEAGVRTFPTTSAGRLFDTAAALLGFYRQMSFEGQAAMWLEQLARRAGATRVSPMPFDGGRLDYRPALVELIGRRRRGGEREAIARGFHESLSAGLLGALERLAEEHQTRVVALSGGVLQNRLLVSLLAEGAAERRLELWANQRVPANDGGVSLGQAALARCRARE
ncbi:MAG TPA: carbamoyltransferase HypF [Thermoanaerobaculia bacterium]|nr:carbamoyltransferase HypF [Thermoanaerobaculia bacterium]